MFYEIVERVYRMMREGRPVLGLHVGDTNLPAPQAATAAALETLGRGRSTYGPSAGLPALRERIARREGCSPEQVVVGTGSKHLIFGLLSVLGEAGRRVAIPGPSWPAYGLIARQLGLEPRHLPAGLEDGWQPEPAALAGCDLALLCNPLNPTSTLYEPAFLAQVRDGVRHLILDEAYRGLAFGPLATLEGAIRVRSFSKEFNLEGWRLGYAVAPEALARELVRFTQITTTCVPDFVQAAGLACLEQEEAILGRHREVWRERSGFACAALGRAGFRFREPAAGMYVFATHDALRDGDAFAAALLEDGVAVAPGSAFGCPGFFRLCANQDAPVLEAAIAAMGARVAARS